jgi:LacI family transcriptional regulator
MSITIAELARRCGVSTATVSLVLNRKDQGRVSPAQRQRILRLADRHGYRSNVAAKGLVEGRTYRVAVVVEGALAHHALIGQFSFYERLGLLADQLRDRGYLMEICQVDPARPAAAIARDLARASAEGFILLAWPGPAATRLLTALRQQRLPAIACGSTLATATLSWVDVDRRASVRTAVRHLVGLGHRELAFLDLSVRPSLFAPVRTRAFLDAVREQLGVDGRPWVFASATAALADAVATGERALRALPRARAFLLADNLHGELFLHLLALAGRPPGRACHVLGFGDTVLAQRCRPALAHYSLQNEAQVRFCLATLFQARTGAVAAPPPQHELLPPLFIAGGTCPAAPPG